MLASFLENMDLVCLEYVESNGNFLIIQECDRIEGLDVLLLNRKLLIS